MGLLVNGEWKDEWYDTKSTGGKFVRNDSIFRNWVTTDGSAGETGKEGFKAEPNRYHLYVSLACPWAHRTLIFRTLKGLEEMISVSVVNHYMAENGWTFEPNTIDEVEVKDHLFRSTYMHEVYTQSLADYTGRVTVPVLWDKQQNCIVSNESADIIRMFNSAFDDVDAKEGDYYPDSLIEKIAPLNERIYNTLNNGVYKSGFSTTQAAYEEAVYPLFETLDFLEEILSENRYLTGSTITEADWRLFTTLIRFDAVYHGHFKCNLRRIVDYPNLWGYTRELYQWPDIASTVNFKHIKTHYYGSHKNVNPTGIVPAGPSLNLLAPHRRG